MMPIGDIDFFLSPKSSLSFFLSREAPYALASRKQTFTFVERFSFSPPEHREKTFLSSLSSCHVLSSVALPAIFFLL